MTGSGPNVRKLASELLLAIVDGDFDREKKHALAAESLSTEDRALFGHLTSGVLREWEFLGACLKAYASKPAKPKTRIQFAMGAYQLLFLDRVPEHAVFSEMKDAGTAAGLAKEELGFVHATLKKVQAEKSEWLRKREEALRGLLENGKENGELERAVLNAPAALVDALTVVEAEKATNPLKRQARERAVRALLAMKREPELVGFALEEGAEKRFKKFDSALAGGMLDLPGGSELTEALKSGGVRVQGEASQWVCEEFAAALAGGKRGVRVLELGSGKGGKLLGTLARLKAKSSGALAGLEWVACENSKAQLKVFESSTLPLARKHFPEVEIKVLKEVPEADGEFDFALCDAPCTGFGTLSKLPQIALTRGENAYAEARKAALLQRELLDRAAKALKPGAECFYSVCTLTRPETLDLMNELVRSGAWEVKSSRSLWPGHEPAPLAEGFFLARLIRL